MLRVDGRSTSELRPLQIVLESLDRVDGSGSFSFGQTKALASVSGPIQVRLPAELPSKATFEVLVRPLSGVPGTDAKSIATVLRSLLVPCLILTQNPRALIQLVIQSLTPPSPCPNPSLTAAFINASSLALIQASSFPMLGVVCAVAVGRLKDDTGTKNNVEKLLLDPDEQEIQQCDAVGCVAVMFGGRSVSGALEVAGGMGETKEVEAGIVWSSLQGIALQSDYDALMRLAKTGAKSVYEALGDRIREELEETRGVEDEPLAKKIPKHKGGRVAVHTGTEDAMDTT